MVTLNPKPYIPIMVTEFKFFNSNPVFSVAWGFEGLGLWASWVEAEGWDYDNGKENGNYYMGGCQNYGPFLGTLYIRCRIIIGTQKGTIILTTTHIIIGYVLGLH